jgi:hypothetical protein
MYVQSAANALLLGASPRKCVFKITRTLICPLSVFPLCCKTIDAKVVSKLESSRSACSVLSQQGIPQEGLLLSSFTLG